jgi:(1->4)-alpha-D-glucan 1-alpha-D-glucosylmutase
MVANFPTGTYRVQVRPGFDLDATAGLAGYLHELGASHLYTAPILTATPGSAHGYDVVDPRRVNPQLGGEAARQRLVVALRQQGLGLVVDIVPNHMGLFRPDANPMWWDVLAKGRASAYADWFDIEWATGPIVVPVLGAPGTAPGALDALRVEDGELRYYEHRFPIAPGTAGGTPQEVHDRQHYRLVYWREGNERLNYRRFFAVTELAGVRVEDPAVFEATHAELLRWVAAGDVDGIRVDHPDGLLDPDGYLTRLRERAPDAWLLVEKILERGEPLPPHWPIDGTTGYDALAEVCGLFIDPAGELRGLRVHRGWAEEAHDQKLDVTTRLFPAELHRLGRLAPGSEEALRVLAASFEVYRTYLPYGREHFDKAFAEAREHRPDLADTFDALESRLTDPADELCARFQQLTGAVMAKGVEDTAMYRWNRFVALNEVGGDPSRFGVPPEEFHAAAQRRHDEWPAGMTTLSTHDTKRGEDVRARLAVLSELPEDWAATVERLRTMAPLPDPSFEALFWQTIVGAWPIEQERLQGYFVKAAREANGSTSWDAPDEGFESAVAAVLGRVFDDPVLRKSVEQYVAAITPFGWSNSLGQKLVQLTMPGIPDVYQGTELWENSLVDPDNRRPVDFAERRDLLAALDAEAGTGVAALPPIDVSGAAKLLVVSRALRLRRDRPQLFQRYHPVPATGGAAAHVVAFDRGGALTVVKRLPVGLAARGGWGDTELKLPGGDWTDVLTGRPVDSVAVADLLDTYPVALLERG